VLSGPGGPSDPSLAFRGETDSFPLDDLDRPRTRCILLAVRLADLNRNQPKKSLSAELFPPCIHYFFLHRRNGAPLDHSGRTPLPVLLLRALGGVEFDYLLPTWLQTAHRSNHHSSVLTAPLRHPGGDPKLLPRHCFVSYSSRYPPRISSGGVEQACYLTPPSPHSA